MGDVQLDIEEGEKVVIQGPTGGGKSTLLQILGSLDRPTAGTVLFDGDDLPRMSEGRLTGIRARAFGFVFQTFNLIPTLTALENVETHWCRRTSGPPDGVSWPRRHWTRWGFSTGRTILRSRPGATVVTVTLPAPGTGPAAIPRQRDVDAARRLERDVQAKRGGRIRGLAGSADQPRQR